MHDSALFPEQEKNEALRAAAAAANKGGSANEARLQDREQYIASLQARLLTWNAATVHAASPSWACMSSKVLCTDCIMACKTSLKSSDESTPCMHFLAAAPIGCKPVAWLRA
jgi:hypothetical protein